MNRYQPHVLLLPEDDANRQLANGFLLDALIEVRNVQVLAEAGGWNSVLERFLCDHVSEMVRWPERLMVLLIDFDNDQRRLSRVQDQIPIWPKEFLWWAHGESHRISGGPCSCRSKALV